MSIFSGLDKFGLVNTENTDIYDDQKNTHLHMGGETPKKEEKEVKKIDERELIYAKTSECPVCESSIRHLVVKSSRARLVSTDRNLRPVHYGIDILKYDVIHCNVCGYAVLTRYYGPLPKPHRELIKEKISMKYVGTKPEGDIVTYSEALYKYKLALFNAVCRQAKDSERALICLKTGWLVRGMLEHMDELPQNEDFSEDKLKQMEEDFLKEAMKGFTLARMKERYHVAGMNETTLDYLLATLCERFGEYEDALKLLFSVVTSSQSNASQKDKAREMILEIKKKKAE